MGINSEAVHQASEILAAAANAGVKAQVVGNPFYTDAPLSEAQTELIGEVRKLGSGMNDMMAELMSSPDTDKRWASIGATHLQQGLMAIERAIAKPLKF